MNSKKVFFVLLAVVIILGIGVVAVGYEANAILTQKSTTLSKLKADALVSDELQQSLVKDKADIKKYSELNIIAQTIVPQDKDQSETVREVVKIATDSGIAQLTAITFPASQLGANALGSTDALSQLTPVKGIPGVYLLPITVSVDSSNQIAYAQFMAFLQKLENNRRTAQISDITIKPDQSNTNVLSFSLVINEYIKP